MSTADTDMAPDPLAIDVLVSPGCAGCAHARALVAQLRRARPRVRVDVVDVTRDGAPLPEGFAGTPMFFQGGRVLSYGNPTLDDLIAAVDGGTHDAS